MSMSEPRTPQLPGHTPDSNPQPPVSINEVHGVLRKVAARQVSAWRGQADFQATCIVNEVLANHWDRIRKLSTDKNVLMFSLFGQMKRQIIHRIRALKRRRELSLDAVEFAEPAAAGPSPTEIVAGQESEGVRNASWEKSARLKAIIDAALPDPRDRRLVWMYLCESKSSDDVGVALEMSRDHVRVRAREIKHRTAAAVLAELKGAIDADTATLANRLFSDERAAAEIAASIGLDEVALRRRLYRAICQPALRRYGEPGVRLFHACLARARKKRR